MRILMLNAAPDRSEAHLCRSLPPAGWEVDLAGPADAPALRRLAADGLSVHDLRIRLAFDPPAVLKLRRLLRARQPNLLHAFSKKALCHALLAAAGIPLPVVAYRGYIGHLHRYGPQTRWAFRHPKVRRIICVSEAVRRFLLGIGLPPQRLVTIYKGHDPAWYAPLPAERLREFGIPPGAFVVGTAGKLRPRKGLDDLVRAAARLPRDSVHYLLVGELADRRLRPLIRRLGLETVMHFAGFRPDAAGLMGACDAFVLCSPERDALPRALLEAQAQGVPAVVTGVGGLPEVVADGENGLVVPPRQPAALAAAIQILAGDAALRRRLGAGARERVRARFHIAETVRQTLAVYREALGAGASQPSK